VFVKQPLGWMAWFELAASGTAAGGAARCIAGGCHQGGCTYCMLYTGGQQLWEQAFVFK
jgi:hypothetical protein